MFPCVEKAPIFPRREPPSGNMIATTVGCKIVSRKDASRDMCFCGLNKLSTAFPHLYFHHWKHRTISSIDEPHVYDSLADRIWKNKWKTVSGDKTQLDAYKEEEQLRQDSLDTLVMLCSTSINEVKNDNLTISGVHPGNLSQQ